MLDVALQMSLIPGLRFYHRRANQHLLKMASLGEKKKERKKAFPVVGAASALL